MVLTLGLCLWLAALAAVVRLTFLARWPTNSIYWKLALGLAVLVGSVVLYFRPHEDILGGEDPGSYVNSAVSYARHKSFFHIDPLLAEVALPVRPQFLYGHSQYGTTKDACLWVRNMDQALIGPHFQPAYPLLMGVPARVASPAWTLYVVPLFALFGALALWVLGGELMTHRWAGMLACLFYLGLPITVWHGRCARPEIIAAFFFFGGSALLLHAWNNPRWSRWTDILLGAVCVGLAPFLHVTAWLLVIPAALAVGLLILSGRDDFLIYPVVAMGLLAVFLCQLVFVTDYYKILQFIPFLVVHPVWAGLLGLVLLAGLAFGSFWIRKRQASFLTEPAGNADVKPPEAPKEDSSKSAEGDTVEKPITTAVVGDQTTPADKPKVAAEEPAASSHAEDAQKQVPPADSQQAIQDGASRQSGMVMLMMVGWIITGLFLFMMVLSFFTRDTAGSLPLLGRPIEHYLYLTDFVTVVNMVTIPVAVLALVGWTLWVPGRPDQRGKPVAFALVLVPALLMAGNMNDFMMTRYMMVAIAPTMALCLAAVATAIPYDSRKFGLKGGAITLGLAVVIIGCAWINRTHLATLEEHKGLIRFLRPFAEAVQADNGKLLCEYSRLAAPMEHLFGLDVLGLDNQRHDDYTQADQAWETLMIQHPEWAMYFMTPFQPPISDRFVFTPVKDEVFPDRYLQRAFKGLPTQIKTGPLRLRLYRMKARIGGRIAEPEAAFPFVCEFDAGNEGLRQFANLRDRPLEIQGIRLEPGKPFVIKLDEAIQFTEAREIMMLALGSSAKLKPLAVECASEIASYRSWWQALANDWWLYRLSGDPLLLSDEIMVVSSAPLVLNEIIVILDDRVVYLSDRFPGNQVGRARMTPFKSRWARAEARALLPVPKEKQGRLLTFVYAPKTDQAQGRTLTIGGDSWRGTTSHSPSPDRWRWLVSSFADAALKGDRAWFTFRSEPPWNSGAAGFPEDLGFLMGYLVVVPMP